VESPTLDYELAASRKSLSAHDVFRPAKGRLTIRKPDCGDGQQYGVANLVPRDAFGQGVSHSGMHAAFGAGTCGYPDLDQPPRASVQRTGTVTFLSELLKRAPDLSLSFLKSSRPLREFCLHLKSPL